jgi:hypothetical protein
VSAGSVTRDTGPSAGKIKMGGFAMFIVVEHIVSNPKAFWDIAKVAQIPHGIKLLQSFPNISADRGVCLWETESVEKLKGFMEPLFGPFSRNTYYEVDVAKAVGLPAIAAAA